MRRWGWRRDRRAAERRPSNRWSNLAALHAEHNPREARAWYAEYVASLKAVELEEWLDLVLYRPLAFGVTKVVAPTPITPNQISVASLFFGLLAGWLLWVGSTEAALLAAGSYFVCNVLDCADGQLARLRGKPSPFGYIVDGSIDYLASVAVFGQAHHLTLQRPGEHNWYLIGTLAGLPMPGSVLSSTASDTNGRIGSTTSAVIPPRRSRFSRNTFCATASRVHIGSSAS